MNSCNPLIVLLLAIGHSSQLVAFADAPTASIVGEHAIYERDGEIWLVVEILGMTEADRQHSESSPETKQVLVVACSMRCGCRLYRVTDERLNDSLPALTWHKNIPILLGPNATFALALRDPRQQMNFDAQWLNEIRQHLPVVQTDDRDLLLALARRNREQFGVKRTVRGGEMGVSLGQAIEVGRWRVVFGDGNSDLNCHKFAIETQEDEVKIAFSVEFPKNRRSTDE